MSMSMLSIKSTQTVSMKSVIGRIPFLNCAPFFYGWSEGGLWDWVEVPPRQLGLEAREGRVVAGPMALADFLCLQDRFERLGNLGIAARGRCQSITLFSRKPIRQLDGATIAVTEETSTTALLLRLILEQRYFLAPQGYQPACRAGSSERDKRGAGRRGDADLPAAIHEGQAGDADAVLLIGDEALRLRAANRRYPYEIDLSFEWWLWQHLPCVFAVWAVRKDVSPEEKQRLSRALQKQLAMNLTRLQVIAQERASSLGMPANELQAYLEHFTYRFGEPEERAITQFAQLLHAHHLL